LHCICCRLRPPARSFERQEMEHIENCYKNKPV
jgi:hypothetical protein